MACDLIVAAEGTKLGEPEIRYGSAPVTLLMPYLIGQKRTRELLLTGDLIDAAEAERIGLVNRVVPADELAAEVDALADRLARTPPEVMGPTKRMLNRAMDAAGFRLAVEAGWTSARSSTPPTRPSSASGTRSSAATASRRRSPGAIGGTTRRLRRRTSARDSRLADQVRGSVTHRPWGAGRHVTQPPSARSHHVVRIDRDRRTPGCPEAPDDDRMRAL